MCKDKNKVEFIFSYKLQKLWAHINQKDNFDEAASNFMMISHFFCEANDNYTDLLDTIQKLDGGKYFVFENYPNPFEDKCFFLFLEDSEVEIYNKILRKWCQDTGRKIKKKK